MKKSDFDKIGKQISEEKLLQLIIGEQLSSVEFVQNYIQLRFDGPVLTVISYPVVKASGKAFLWGEPGFRDEICKRISIKVVRASITPKQSVEIGFEDGSTIEISTRSEDYRAAEAVKFDYDHSQWWVI